MKRYLKRGLTVIGLVGAMVAGTATGAMAITGNGYDYLHNDQVNLNAYVYWWPSGQNYGGMDVSGTVYNTSGDGNGVKVQGKVSGYGYTDLWSTTGTSLYGDRVVYDPQALYVTYGAVNICHHEYLWADECTAHSENR